MVSTQNKKTDRAFNQNLFSSYEVGNHDSVLEQSDLGGSLGAALACHSDHTLLWHPLLRPAVDTSLTGHQCPHGHVTVLSGFHEGRSA